MMNNGKISDINEHTYEKDVVCPVCNSHFKVRAVKVNSPRVASKDSDFFIRYNVINPYFYDVWVCSCCGYAAMKVDFPKIKSFQKELVLTNISKEWRKREFPLVPTVDDAIEKYKLALLNATIMGKPSSTQGMILLKLSWMYRLAENKEKESVFLKQALRMLEEAFSNEDFPIYGLQRDSFTYLLGDLNRRIGNYSDALRWYSNVITTVGASQRIKEMARDGKDSIPKDKE